MKINLDNVEKMYSNGPNAMLTDPNSIEEQIVGPGQNNDNFKDIENPTGESANNLSNINNSTVIENNNANTKLNNSIKDIELEIENLEEKIKRNSFSDTYDIYNKCNPDNILTIDDRNKYEEARRSEEAR